MGCVINFAVVGYCNEIHKLCDIIIFMNKEEQVGGLQCSTNQ